jgi:dihydrofolate synthase/folylpolyglutamate synthase
VDGQAVPRRDYEALIGKVAATLARVSDLLPDGGYLSPSGLFTLSALRHFADLGCDAVVLEAGMGGASDEVSLVAPGVVVVTPILSEHLGVLGDSVAEIAAEKAGVITAATRDVVAAAQEDPGAERAVLRAARRHGSRCHRAVGGDDRPGPAPAPGLGGLNARLGVVAALRLLAMAGRPEPAPEALDASLGSVSLPGRLSHHRRGEQEWIIDCATNPAAVTAAISHAAATIGSPTAVLTFIPPHRDPAPLLATLRGQPVVRVPGGPSAGGPGGGAVMRLEEVDLDTLGPRVLALGPVYFVGELLATLDVDCERSFRTSQR